MDYTKNNLFFGNNLAILRSGVIEPESVNLTYLDPPFNSDANYNILFREEGSGKKSAAQITAFEDTWSWNPHVEEEYHLIVTQGPERVSKMMQAFRDFLKQSDMMAYLTMMAPRLVEIHKVLKPTGSIYLHCDPTASHYLKLLMDAIFRPENFKSEIIWRRTGSHNSTKRFGPIHDTILFYAKDSAQCYFNTTYRPYLKGHVDSYFKNKDERGRYWTNALTGAGTRKKKSGEPWRTYNPTAVGRHWAIPGKIATILGIDETLSPQEKLDLLDAAGYIDHPTGADSKAMPTYRQYLETSPGMPSQDIWAYQPHTRGVLWNSDEAIDEDARWLVAQGDDERLDYPTQKPEGVLSRIIRSSSKEGDVVFDPFCGGGTTMAVAEELKRRWIGIDVTHLAIARTRTRLREHHGFKLSPYEVHGVPTDVEGARALANEDRYKFQEWVIGELDARRWQDKKGADSGVDGYIYFDDEGNGKYKRLLIQVKSGHVKSGDIRDLVGTVKREDAIIGVYVTLEPATKPMRDEAATAGVYEAKLFPGMLFPRIQILTIEEMFAGKTLAYPQMMATRAYKKAQPKEEKAEQAKMF